jgi:N-acetylglucosaminyl-diphospho-decaprenol L-rhamnosyltransferase
MPTIGVVIVSYNTRELLRACLESLRGCTLPLRVVVVDSASLDGSAALVRSAFPEVGLVESPRNLGFAAGNNLGLRFLLDHRPPTTDQRPTTNDEGQEDKETRRQGDKEIDLAPSAYRLAPDYILFLNPDTIVHPDAIEGLVAFVEAHPRVGAAGPRLLNPDGSVQAAAFRFPTLMMTLLDLFPPGQALPGRLYGSWWNGRYPQERGCAPFPIDHPLGACILTRRRVLEQVGGMDEQFFMYAEEVDWCYRVRRAGWAIWQVPQARVTHVGGAATRQSRTPMLVALYESRLRFFHKHYTPRFVRWHTRIVRAGMLRAALLGWRDYAAGRLGRDELRARLWACGKVSQL